MGHHYVLEHLRLAQGPWLPFSLSIDRVECRDRYNVQQCNGDGNI